MRHNKRAVPSGTRSQVSSIAPYVRDSQKLLLQSQPNANPTSTAAQHQFLLQQSPAMQAPPTSSYHRPGAGSLSRSLLLGAGGEVPYHSGFSPSATSRVLPGPPPSAVDPRGSNQQPSTSTAGFLRPSPGSASPSSGVGLLAHMSPSAATKNKKPPPLQPTSTSPSALGSGDLAEERKAIVAAFKGIREDSKAMTGTMERFISILAAQEEEMTGIIKAMRIGAATIVLNPSPPGQGVASPRQGNQQAGSGGLGSGFGPGAQSPSHGHQWRPPGATAAQPKTGEPPSSKHHPGAAHTRVGVGATARKTSTVLPQGAARPKSSTSTVRVPNAKAGHKNS